MLYQPPVRNLERAGLKRVLDFHNGSEECPTVFQFGKEVDKTMEATDDEMETESIQGYRV